jgi:alkanesulfonate monooxygenase SsuD/methylene tetrahydromethanopterin reductase-like flavin-dependent oxidoreductase (luciferase family)
MKFGITNQTALPPGRTDTESLLNTVEQIVAADECGFDGFWLTEHHFDPYGMACLEPILAHAAAKTRRIRLGAAVWVTPLHHPLRLAENVAALDVLSGGRVNFGVGRGYAVAEFAGFGVDIAQNKAMHEEALDVILRAWTQDEICHEGRFWRIPHSQVHPKPLQKPHPPLFQPLISPGSMDEAVAQGRHAILGPRFQDVETVIPQMMARWRASLAGSGKPLEALVTLPVYVAETDAEARRDLAEPLMWIKQAWVNVMPDTDQPAQTQMKARIAGLSFDETFATCLAGGIETVAARLAALQRQAGLEHVLCSMHFGSLSNEHVLRSMELMARHIVPRFR